MKELVLQTILGTSDLLYMCPQYPKTRLLYVVFLCFKAITLFINPRCRHHGHLKHLSLFNGTSYAALQHNHFCKLLLSEAKIY